MVQGRAARGEPAERSCRDANYLGRQGGSVTGFDVSEEVVVAARRNATQTGIPLDFIDNPEHQPCTR
jgi:hypothetical protein